MPTLGLCVKLESAIYKTRTTIGLILTVNQYQLKERFKYKLHICINVTIDAELFLP
jgi:hypothetical protein